MKKTLLITIDFPPNIGGVANYWSNLLKYLSNESIVVLAPENNESLKFDIEQRYIIYRRNLYTQSQWLWPKWLPFLFYTWQIARKEKVEQIIAAQVLPGGTIAWIIRLITGLPYILSFHGLDISMTQTHWRKKWLGSKIIGRAKEIFVNSEYTRNKVRKIAAITAREVKVIYPGPNVKGNGEIPTAIIDTWRQKYGLAGKRILLSVGRLVERKGFDLVIRAVAELKNDFPDLTYLIVGQGTDLHRLESISRHYCVDKNVLIISDIKDDELPYLYSMAMIFVMPARELPDGDVEGFGIVFLEANLFCLPVIAGRSGGIPEAVAHGESGLLVDPTSFDELVKALRDLLHNPDRAKDLGQRGRLRVLNQFTWSAQADKLKILLS